MDPANLTIDKLKKDLDSRKVPYSKSAKKGELVELHRKHVQSGSVERRSAGYDFSSDDDDALQLRPATKIITSSRKTSEKRMVSRRGVNVGSMNDSELIKMLQSHKIDVGPVTDTTRVVYKKKLLKLLDGSGVTPSRRNEDDEEEEEEEQYRGSSISRREEQYSNSDEDDDETDAPSPQRWTDKEMENLRRRQDGSSLKTTGVSSAYSNTDSLGRTTTRIERVTKHTTMVAGDLDAVKAAENQHLLSSNSVHSAAPSSGLATSRASPAKRICPIWCQLLVLILFAGFIFLVIQNMDESWSSQLRRLGM